MSASPTTIDPAAPAVAAPSLAAKLQTFAADIKVSHTVFAMPWAILAAVMAWEVVRGPIGGKLALIVACMVTARTFAMAANRLTDAEIDRSNPRTAGRAIPSGRLSRAFMTFVSLTCAALFVAATFGFWFFYDNAFPLLFGPAVLIALALYPWMKRFTLACHVWLGMCLALAPLCAWVAVAGLPPLHLYVMAFAVLTWTAGFDIIYACQDYACDVRDGVHSVPAKLGVARALWVSRITHAACFALLVTLGVVSPQLGTLYFVGVACAGLLLIVEHAIVKPHDLSKVGMAFFTINGIVSLIVGTLGVIDVLFH